MLRAALLASGDPAGSLGGERDGRREPRETPQVITQFGPQHV